MRCPDALSRYPLGRNRWLLSSAVTGKRPLLFVSQAVGMRFCLSITSIFYPSYARGVRRILQISRGLIIIAFEFITRNFVPRQYFRNAPVSLFRKRLISILAPPSVT